MKQCLLFLFTLIFFSSNAWSAAKQESMAIELLTKQITQFEGVPWGISLLNEQEAIVTIKNGFVYRVNLLNGEQQRLTGLPTVNYRGQGGLLDVARSPNFNSDNLLYFTYSKPMDQGAATTLARAQLIGNKLSQWQDLLVTDSASSKTQHYGSRITFDDKNHVFFSVGDRGTRSNAQDRSNHAGSIIRLNLDGTVPMDNPFVTDSSVRDEIWSYGHRNPQGLFYDLTTQTLWSNEHGPRGGDEINLIEPGANYGWPVVSHGKEYWGPINIGEGQEKEGINSPVKVYVPSIAPSSLIRYRGTLFADWDGDFLSTALVLRHLNRITITKESNTIENRYIESLDEILRVITQDDKGALYLTTDSGKLLQLSLAKP